MLHLYCILSAGRDAPDDCEGLESRRPFGIQAGELVILATEHETPIAASIGAVRVHNAVIAASMNEQMTPVPLRFGQTAADRNAAAESVGGEAERWSGLLRRFAGRAEYGVRVMVEQEDAEQDVHAAKAASGREYMASLAMKQARTAARRTEGERFAGMVAERVGTLADETRVEWGGAEGPVVSISHLVAWTAAEAYHGAMREVREASEDARFLLTGPWPPYSFVA